MIESRRDIVGRTPSRAVWMLTAVGLVCGCAGWRPELKTVPPPPNSLAEYCRPLPSHYANQCLTQGQGKHVDPAALRVCNRITNYSSRIICVWAIADRDYTADELKTCDSYPNAETTTKCLQTSGKARPGTEQAESSDSSEKGESSEGEQGQEGEGEGQGEGEGGGQEETTRKPSSGYKRLTINNCKFSDSASGQLGKMCRAGRAQCNTGYTCYIVGRSSVGVCVPSDQARRCR